MRTVSFSAVVCGLFFCVSTSLFAGDFFEITTAKAFEKGTLENVQVDKVYGDGAVILQREQPKVSDSGFCSQGVFTSEPIDVPRSDWFTPSWNVRLPQGTAVDVFISVRIPYYDDVDGEESAYWTEFLPVRLHNREMAYGEKFRVDSVAMREDSPSEPRAWVEDDVLRVGGEGRFLTQIRFQVKLQTENPQFTPVVALLSGTTRNIQNPLFPITNGFTYASILVFLAALLIGASKYCPYRVVQAFFHYAPPVVLLYLSAMLLCTVNLWDLKATEPTYNHLKNNLLYAMLFLMLLHCDLRKIIKLGPRMLLGFFSASFTVVVGFVVTFLVMHSCFHLLGEQPWAPLSALCGSWIGGSGNMVAIQSAFNIDSANMANALVVDTVNYSIWVMFLLWMVGFAPGFNRWIKTDTRMLDEVSQKLEAEMIQHKREISFPSLLLLIGSALFVSVVVQFVGLYLSSAGGAFAFLGYLDKATWSVLLVTILGMTFALTPFGRVAGSAELSSVFLYIVIALLASRASLAELENAPAWIASGFMILLIHGTLLLLIAKLFRLDLFTCSVASLANIGGVASAPILAGAYSPALVPIAVLMAFMGTVTGTFVGLMVGYFMRCMS